MPVNLNNNSNRAAKTTTTMIVNIYRKEMQIQQKRTQAAFEL